MASQDHKPELFDLLYLLTIPNIGPGRIRKLMQVYRTAEEIRQAPVQELVQVEGIDYKLAEQLKTGGDLQQAEDQLRRIEKLKVRYLTIWDEEYPALLKRIPDPPVVLFYRGTIRPEHGQAIAVVGTRTPSNYGKVVTSEIVRQLVSHGFTIVSGMARGVDAIAHHTAIQAGGETLAVLGNGVDRCYPADNRSLYESIPKHGALLSEFFLGTGPDAANFPRRNRIISGMALGTLVVEAGERSGALITAYYALNHNREVFAIPGNITSPRSRGTNRLIQQGAKLVRHVEDILEELPKTAGASPPSKPAERELPENLTELERKILNRLSGDPLHIDRLVMELRESPSVILSELLTLELMGLVQQLPGKMFVRM